MRSDDESHERKSIAMLWKGNLHLETSSCYLLRSKRYEKSIMQLSMRTLNRRILAFGDGLSLSDDTGSHFSRSVLSPLPLH